MVRTRTRRQMPAKKLSARWDSDERRWLDDFLSGVRTQFADAVRDVVIYGSKARGDWHEASDIDVLIILADEREGEEEGVKRLGYGLSVMRDALPCLVAWTEAEWEKLGRRDSGLHEAVEREGISVL